MKIFILAVSCTILFTSCSSPMKKEVMSETSFDRLPASSINSCPSLVGSYSCKNDDDGQTSMLSVTQTSDCNQFTTVSSGVTLNIIIDGNSHTTILNNSYVAKWISASSAKIALPNEIKSLVLEIALTNLTYKKTQFQYYYMNSDTRQLMGIGWVETDPKDEITEKTCSKI